MGVNKAVVTKRYNAQLFNYFALNKLLLYLCPEILAQSPRQIACHFPLPMLESPKDFMKLCG